MQKLFLLLTFFLFINLATAQNLSIISKANEDNIELRWIPMNSSAWRYANSTGYRLERITIMRKGKMIS